MQRYLLLPVLLLCLLQFSATVFATEQYAVKTGHTCSACHLNPSGGGELNEVGEGFALSLLASPPGEQPAVPQTARAFSFFFRLVAGYVHILFGFFWFGTILYVHLILKPAYASGGLPRGEVKLGLLSMLVMAVTGVILTVYRVPSFEVLVSTRFGILLCLKILLFLIMVGSALCVVLYIGPRLKNKARSYNDTPQDELTTETLPDFDGKNNRQAFIAYRGKIYDVSASPLWKNGSHMGRHAAGYDLSEELKQAPHGEDKVLAMPEIGSLQSGSERRKTPQQKIFYVMAYMNLGFVLLIILILALWNWW